MSAAPMNYYCMSSVFLRWLGSGFALFGVIFVGVRFYSYCSFLSPSSFDFHFWPWICLLALVYGVSNTLLAYAWSSLLHPQNSKMSAISLVKIYGISQLAKYVPGNIFQFAGRQALGMAAGLPARVLAKSSFWELALIVAAGSLYAFLTLPLIFPSISIITSIILLLVILYLARVFLKYKLGFGFARAFELQFIFLGISGAIFVMQLSLFFGGGYELGHSITIAGSFVVAWLIGMVTPGAPAGMGVREMILLILLQRVAIERDLLLAIMSARLVTVCGDLIFFVASGLTSLASQNPKTANH